MFKFFEEYGPKHLSAVDWNCARDRKSVAACLVHGTSVQQHARLKMKKKRLSAAAPDCTWWKQFGFDIFKEIIDIKDDSICGAVYQFNPSLDVAHSESAPDYVVAFRGTMLRRKTFKQDLKLDLKLISYGLDRTSRATAALQAVENLVSTNGNSKTVWVAGHSLGAAIAMLVGKHMVISKELQLETFLFNPPFTGIPINRFIGSEKLKRALRLGKTSGIAIMMAVFMEEQLDAGREHFDKLKSWVPHMFVNKKDYVCSEYIGHFEHRKDMERIGLEELGRLTAQNSLRSFLSNAFGRKALPLHLLPSAALFVNKIHYSRDIKFGSHCLNQWWRQDLDLVPKEYCF